MSKENIDKTIRVNNPITNELIGEVAISSSDEINIKFKLFLIIPSNLWLDDQKQN